MKNVAESREERESSKLFNFRPAFFAAIFLILGIVYGYFRLLKGISALWLLAFVPVALLPLCFSEGRRDFIKRTLAIALLAVSFAVGAACFSLQATEYARCPTYSGEVTVVGTVESRKEYGNTTRIRLRDIVVDEKGVEGRLNATLPTLYAQNIGIADRVVLVGEIATNTEYIGEYGFRSDAIGKKIRYILYAYEGVAVDETNNAYLRIRARMERVVYEGMDETPAAFTLALLTGDVSGIEEGLSENMRYGGISHIFAVSGLNVGALYLVCLFLFSKTPLQGTPKPVRFLLLVGILLLYSGVCGFSASVVRAAIFCAVAYFCKLLGTGTDPLNALGAAAILILLLCPSELFGVGFQLSFLACLGLFLLTKRIGQVFDEVAKCYRRRFPKKYTAEQEKLLKNGDILPQTVGERVWKWTKELLSASLAAQIATAPALLIHFGYLSGWAMLLNFIFVPFTDGIFTLLLLLVAVACLLPVAVAPVLLYLPSIVWSAAMLLFEIADFSTFALRGVQITLGGCVCYYSALTFLSDKWNIPKWLNCALFWLFFLCFGVTLL